MDDDSKYVEKALREYQEATWNDAEFEDLPREVQQKVLQRAQQLKVFELGRVAAA
jgi:hypothetical protein